MRKVQRNGYRVALIVSVIGLLSAIILCAISYMLNYGNGMLMGLGFVILDSILIGITGTKARALNRVYKYELEALEFINKMEKECEDRENDPFKEFNSEERQNCEKETK